MADLQAAPDADRPALAGGFSLSQLEESSIQTLRVELAWMVYARDGRGLLYRQMSPRCQDCDSSCGWIDAQAIPVRPNSHVRTAGPPELPIGDVALAPRSAALTQASPGVRYQKYPSYTTGNPPTLLPIWHFNWAVSPLAVALEAPCSA